jgi:hypothetical protein
VFADDRFEIGSRLDLDVLLPDGTSLRCWGEVVWLVELEVGAPAYFDLGLKFTDMAEADIQRLAAVLVRDQGPTP